MRQAVSVVTPAKVPGHSLAGAGETRGAQEALGSPSLSRGWPPMVPTFGRPGLPGGASEGRVQDAQRRGLGLSQCLQRGICLPGWQMRALSCPWGHKVMSKPRGPAQQRHAQQGLLWQAALVPLSRWPLGGSKHAPGTEGVVGAGQCPRLWLLLLPGRIVSVARDLQDGQVQALTQTTPARPLKHILRCDSHRCSEHLHSLLGNLPQHVVRKTGGK